MCGIAGFIGPPGRSDQMEAAARAMADTLRHRGPDDAGVWVNGETGVAFGHRRLSIVDLSPAGHQPMISGNGRMVLTYNGEVYNAAEIRRELEALGHAFRGHSDTEVIAEGCAEWGVDALTPKLIGMFAFALWDRQSRTLSLVRDRVGIKPLYWGRFGGTVLFASELKALRAHPLFEDLIDRDAIVSLLRHNYIRGPGSIYEGVAKLAPGHFLHLAADGKTSEQCYWDFEAIARGGVARSGARGDDDPAAILAELDALLRDAVAKRTIADVPLGAFLSGGIDSSTVVALMQAQSTRPVRTFTIGFDEAGYDEAQQAKAVAAHLGTDHTELYVDPGLGRDVIPGLPELFDEPFADASQIPTFLVSHLTRQHVTVALSGDGGDEVFAGYTRYLWADAIWRRLGPLPRGVRGAVAGGLRALPPHTWDRLLSVLPRRLRPPQAGERMHKIADILPQDSIDTVYRALISQWQNPASGVSGGSEPGGILFDEGLAARHPDAIARMQVLDTLTYLPDDILTKVDRASMAVSLEARVPLLDHRVVEFAWSLPRRLHTRNRQGKWLLRQILNKYVPRELVERPKQGFAVPIGAWLRGPLRDWAEHLLDERRLREDGFLQANAIRRLWDEHQSGRRNRQYQLWGPLMFQAWRDHTSGPP